jgi:transcriptional regulator with XRE-family HTH domain
MAAEHVRALGERIRVRREELGMTQDEVARQMKGTVDGQRISKWERGENRPRDESLEDLARVLQTTIAGLLMPELDKTETPDLSKLALPADALTSRFDALEERVTAQLAEHARKVEALLRDQDALLERQSEILQRIEAAVASDTKIRDEISALIDLRAPGIVQGDPPAAAPDPPPALPRTADAGTTPAGSRRTRQRP